MLFPGSGVDAGAIGYVDVGAVGGAGRAAMGFAFDPVPKGDLVKLGQLIPYRFWSWLSGESP